MDPAAALVEARRRAGVSRRELARRAGTSAAALAAYEQGRKEPGVRTFERLLAAAGVELEPRFVTRADGGDAATRAADLVEVLTLAEHLPHRPRGRLAFPPLQRALR